MLSPEVNPNHIIGSKAMAILLRRLNKPIARVALGSFCAHPVEQACLYIYCSEY